MKKSIEILAHLFFWVIFTISVFVLTRIFMKASPNAPAAQHISYVVFLELIMGLIFFYTTFLGIPWARRGNMKKFILAAVLMLFLVIFAIPATRFGLWEVLSSILPHIMLIFLGFIFRGFSESNLREISIS